MNEQMGEGMSSARMEAFSDGVIAIIITIMVLELKAPKEANAGAVLSTWPIFVSYALSFTTVAIYWINHHHLLHLCRRVDKQTLWLNIHWLFWLSLFPVTTAYIGETRASPFAIAIYAALSMVVATSFLLLQRRLMAANSHLAAVSTSSKRRLMKNLAATISTMAAIPIAYAYKPLSVFLLVVPALSYLFLD